MINYNFSEDKVILKEIARIVSNIAGIQLGEKQYAMIENRLKSRMAKLTLQTFEEYLSYLKENNESETEVLISLLTTHHTYFFREFSQFEYILNRKIKDIITAVEKRDDKKIKVWSAACSTGQEVYSLAMFLDYHLKHLAPHLDFEIWGTDIDNESILSAQNGVYKTNELNKSPAMYLNHHWIQGKNNVRDFSKVRDSIKSKCHFSTLNLLKTEEFQKNDKFDLLFCRNVFIYFNSQQIESIAAKLISKLSPVGSFVLGVSESLRGLNLPVESVGPSVYEFNKLIKTKEFSFPIRARSKEKILNILCVDDSATIHALLASILTPDYGFRVKHRAMNGTEALRLLATHKYDAITLDLHMPTTDGLEFLSRRTDNTPVIIVSAINREDGSIARKAMALGALDYVEKPTKENLVNSGNEIRSKIKSVLKQVDTRTQALQKTGSVPPAVVTAKVIAKKIKTLIVDDSETIRILLTKILQNDPAFEVVGTAKDAFEAEHMIQSTKPDLITLDIHMPQKNGIQLLKEIQHKYAIATVMISALSPEDGPYVVEAISEGAIDYIKKPDLKNLSAIAPVICERLKIAAHAKKIKKSLFSKKVTVSSGEINKEHLVLIGASTGGVEAVRGILEQFPHEIPPILIVQHMPAFFSKAFADRLNTFVSFDVKEAENNDEVRPNRVLVAPGGKNMGVQVVNGKVLIKITDGPFDSRHRPSVDYLFKSVFDAKIKNATAVILTGMGNDGSREIKKLKTLGVSTIAQNEATCVVYGMPRAAYETGAIEYVLPLTSVAEQIIFLAKKKAEKLVS